MRYLHFSLALLSAALLASSAPAKQNVNTTAKPAKGVIPIPLTRHKKTSLKGKESLKLRELGDVDLFDVGEDYAYLATISLGNPAQSFEVQVDTGSSLLMVFGLEFESTSNLALTDMPRGPAFQPELSSAFSYIDSQNSRQPQSVTYQYQDRSFFTASLAQDTVSFGGYEVGNAAFSVAQQGNYSTGPSSSGILGLSWTAINAGPPSRTDQTHLIGLIEQLWHLGALEQPLFSLSLFTQLNTGADYNNDQSPGGQLTLGGLNKELYEGEITYSPLVVDPAWSNDFPGSWSARIDSVTVNGQALPSSTFDTLFDSGSTYSHIPHSIMQNIFAQVDTSQYAVFYDQAFGLWSCLCPENLPPPIESITVTFGGRQFDWPWWAFSQVRFTESGDRICLVSPKASNDNNPSFTLGDDFLKTLYTVYRFDPPAIGLASLKSGLNNSGDPEALSPTSIETLTNFDYALLGVQTTPAFFFPSSLPTQAAFQSVANATQYWNTATQVLPHQPTLLEKSDAAPTASISPGQPQPSRIGKQDGEASSSSESSPLPVFTILVATFVFCAFSTTTLSF